MSSQSSRLAGILLLTLIALNTRVHDTYPEWATHEVPMVVLERLPLLPDELEYRLIGRTLVLWDIDADLILDVLPDAIPGLTS